MPSVAVPSVNEGVTVNPPATASSSVTVNVIESPSSADASAIVRAAATARALFTALTEY